MSWQDYRDVTGITVHYETPHLVKQAVESLRQYHPKFNILIIDGSEKLATISELNKLADRNTAVWHYNYNIGHGKGMHEGLLAIRTRYAVIFDTDIICFQPIIGEMRKLIAGGYGIGNVQPYKFRPPNKSQSITIPYLHPYFALIDVQRYKQYHPFIHHGAPFAGTMYDIYQRGHSNLLKHIDMTDRIVHLKRQTRQMNPKGWTLKWEPIRTQSEQTHSHQQQR